MKILAIDFSTSVRSAALVDASAGESRVLATSLSQGGRETRAFELIESVMNEVRLNRRQVDGFAVGLGPGSYAGIRVSIALAQGWQLATGIPTFGIRTSVVLAETARQQGHRGRLHVAIDAQRGDLHVEPFELTDDEARSVESLRIVSPTEMDFRSVPVAGPDLASNFPAITELFPDAGVLGRLAAKTAPVPADRLTPVYLRPVAFVKAPPPRTDL